jgi:hypothetical protein
LTKADVRPVADRRSVDSLSFWLRVWLLRDFVWITAAGVGMGDFSGFGLWLEFFFFFFRQVWVGGGGCFGGVGWGLGEGCFLTITHSVLVGD